MSCYLPVIEKLKAAVVHKNDSGHDALKPLKSNRELIQAAAELEVRQQQPPRQVGQTDEDAGFYENNLRRPQREANGLTITQEVGEFPHNVPLNIRHTHPSLGLREVAHQRKHSEAPNVQCYLQQQPKGVLSLGLPDNLKPKTLRLNRGSVVVAKPSHHQTATSEAIHHYYETLSPKYMNLKRGVGVGRSLSPDTCPSLDTTIKTDSGQASGGSTNSSVGSHSPPNESAATGLSLPPPRPPSCNRGPPPRHLLPATLKPSPAVKMHPPGVILSLKGKGQLLNPLWAE